MAKKRIETVLENSKNTKFLPLWALWSLWSRALGGFLEFFEVFCFLW